MEQRLYSAATIGEACGVTRQYINRYCKEHCPDAKIGKKININHPVILAFMESKNADTSIQLKPAKERTSHLATTPVSQSESKLSMSRRGGSTQSPKQKLTATQNKTVEQIDISSHGDLTLSELSAYFGSDESYRGWLDAKKKQIEIVERELKVKQRTGEVIDREFVVKNIFGLMEEMAARLLIDSSVTIAVKVYAHKDAGDSLEEATETVRNEQSKVLKGAKSRITKNLKADNDE